MESQFDAYVFSTTVWDVYVVWKMRQVIDKAID